MFKNYIRKVVKNNAIWFSREISREEIEKFAEAIGYRKVCNRAGSLTGWVKKPTTITKAEAEKKLGVKIVIEEETIEELNERLEENGKNMKVRDYPVRIRNEAIGYKKSKN